LVVVPRFVLGLGMEGERPQVPPARWEDTAVVLPQEWEALEMRDAVTGGTHVLDGKVGVAALLRDFPVALLTTVL
jgi:maltooligosyltrehalose synthase